MKKQAYKKVYFQDGHCTQTCGAREVFRRKESKQSKHENSAEGPKGEETGRAESKAEMKDEQKPLARANKFRAVN